MYPTKDSTFGIFVKEQIEETEKHSEVESDLYYINAREKGNLEYLTSLFRIPLKILKGKYDIIHIHYGLSALFLFFYKPKAKTFLTLHGADILEKQGKKVQVYLTKKIMKRVYKVFILSNEMEEVVRPLKINYEVLPCGVNVDFFKPDKITSRDENTKLIVFPGNPLVEVKNYCLFGKVIEYLRQNSPYTIESETVHHLSRVQVKELLNRGDCLLMTSISEGSPQVVKEALACGLPVVSVPVGDVKFMVEQVPYCSLSATYEVKELASLVLKSFLGKGEMVRKAFIDKQFYDHHSITNRIITNYQNSFLSN